VLVLLGGAGVPVAVGIVVEVATLGVSVVVAEGGTGVLVVVAVAGPGVSVAEGGTGVLVPALAGPMGVPVAVAVATAIRLTSSTWTVASCWFSSFLKESPGRRLINAGSSINDLR
jgi:hypothetical protein